MSDSLSSGPESAEGKHRERTYSPTVPVEQHDSRNGTIGEAAGSYPFALLGERGLGAERNASVRSSVMRRAQQSHGNRAVQRFLQAAPAQPASEAGEEEELATRIERASGAGSKLDGAAREKLEAGLGADLSGVRVHTGAEADRLARSVSASAFTSGQDIFFREGVYDPHSSEGLKLLAHEVTHTVQQAAGPVAGTEAPGGVSISDPSDSFEQAAEATAARIAEGKGAPESPAAVMAPASPSSMTGAAPVQRGGIVNSIGSAMGGGGGGGAGGGLFDDILNGVGGAARGIAGGVGSAVGGVAEEGGGLLGGIGSAVSGIAEGVGSAVGGIAGGVGSAVGGLLGGGGLGSVLGGGGGGLGGMLGGLGGMLGEAGIGQPFMPGLGGGGGGLGGGLFDGGGGGLGGGLFDGGGGGLGGGLFDGGGGGGFEPFPGLGDGGGGGFNPLLEDLSAGL